jgi:hypothetical protein
MVTGLARTTSRDALGGNVQYNPSKSQVLFPATGEKDRGEISLWNLNTGIISSTIDDRGTIGRFSPRFQSPANSFCEYLYTAGIWFGSIAAESILVSTAIGTYPSMDEFKSAHDGSDFPFVSDYSIWTLFTDTAEIPFHYEEEEHRPLNIRCILKAHYWFGDPEGNAIIYDLAITNIGHNIIESGYVGLYIDSDVGYKLTEDFWWNDDLAGSLPEYHTAYFIDNDGDPDSPDAYDSTSMSKTIALKFLRSSYNAVDTSFNWWFYDMYDTLDYGPRRIDQYGVPVCRFSDSLENTFQTGIPRYDRDMYCLLSNGEWDYDLIHLIQPPPGFEIPPPELSTRYLNGELKTDVYGVLSLGPADLPPDSSLRVLFTLFTGDSVHTLINNVDNLPQNPDQYRVNLNFDHIIANAELADSLARLLLDPQLPVTGLHVTHNDFDSVVVEWDPWVFDDVDGYDIALYSVPDDSLPYPGILPPWLAPDLSALVESRQTDLAYRSHLDSLSRHHHYFVAMAHRLLDGIGEYSDPIPFQAHGIMPPPNPLDSIVYFTVDQPPVIEWTVPSNVAVDHYNIYKFLSWYDSSDRYYPFYDGIDYSPNPAPRDSFWIADDRYYYYGMTPHVQVDADQTSFSEYIDGSAIYVVTAVDSSGYESEFSDEVLAFEINQQEKDILVITAGFGFEFVEIDSVKSFYDSVLSDYDYDIYDLADSIAAYEKDSLYILRRSLDIKPYKMIIFEDGLEYQLLDPSVDTPYRSHLRLTDALDNYLESGGTLVYCGFFGGFTRYRALYSGPGYRPLDHWFTDAYFGIDSVFQIGIYYYHESGVPYPDFDTLTGLKEAVCPFDTSLSLTYYLMRYPFKPKALYHWNRLTPPGVGAFYPNIRGEITHVVDSRYPETSLIYSHPIGVKTESETWATYLFGFHFWYMDYDGARALIETIFRKAADQPAVVLPNHITLDQNFPNPFNSGTKIRFYLPWKSDAKLVIYNVLGQQVQILLDKSLDAGEHVITWDGTDRHGRPLATGVYFYRIKSGSSSVTRKMILLK